MLNSHARSLLSEVFPFTGERPGRERKTLILYIKKEIFHRKITANHPI